MNDAVVSRAIGSEGRRAPPIDRGACGLVSTPKRIYRKRGPGGYMPHGAIYIGRPSIWGNPFSGQPKIGHARSVILYRSWIAGDLNLHILQRAGFSDSEIEALHRWRQRLLPRLPELCGHDLQCWCPLTSAWCHGDVLLVIARTLSMLAARA